MADAGRQRIRTRTSPGPGSGQLEVLDPARGAAPAVGGCTEDRTAPAPLIEFRRISGRGGARESLDFGR